MTKLEKLLKLSEIKGAILSAESAHVPYGMICELIDDLQNDDEECQIKSCNCNYCSQFQD